MPKRVEPTDNPNETWLHANDHFDAENVKEVEGELELEEYALEFDGVDDYIEFSSSIVPLTDDFVLSYYLKIPEVTNDSSGLLYRCANPNFSFYAYTNIGDAQQELRVWQEDAGEIIVGSNIKDNEWHLVELIRSGNNFTLKVDGVEVGSGTADFSFTNDDNKIGIDVVGNERYFDGIISEVKAISNGQIFFYAPMNEGEGTTVYDESTNNNDGTIYGATWTQSADRLELEEHNALEFDGEDDYVDSNFSYKSQVGTFELWLLAKDERDWRIGYWRSPESRLYFGAEVVGLADTFDRRGGSYYYYGVDHWTHWALVFNDGDYWIYVNGDELYSGSWVGTIDTGDLLFGALYNDGPSNELYGKMCEIRFWSVARTQQEIQNNMNETLEGNETGLVGYWPMIAGSGDTIEDKAGNNDGTIEGATWVSSYSDFPPYFGEGNRISNPLNVDNIKKTLESNIKWAATTPTDTDLKIYTALSDSNTVEPSIDSLEFDGEGNHVEITENIIPVDSDFTIEFWLTVDSNVPDYDDIVVIGTGPNSEDRIYFYSSTTFGGAEDQFRLWCASLGEILIGSDIRGKEWVHIAVVRSGNNWTLYEDGQEIDTNSISGSLSSHSETEFGGGSMDSRWHWGKLSDVRIWDTARTQTEIADNMYSRLAGTETGLVGYWKLDEGTGTTAGDSAGTNDGTISGATWIEDPGLNLVYHKATNDSAIPSISEDDDLTGKYLWIRQELGTNTATSPELTSLEVEIIGGRRLKRYDGSDWVEKSTMVYNGSNWEEKFWKSYDGEWK